MTTIILVAIGILIAAAAALMMIFFGGDAFGNNAKRADAARLVSEGAQIQYATDMYYRQEGEMPGLGSNGAQAIQDLLAKKYLTNVPRGFVSSDGTVNDWKMDYGTDGMIYSHVGLSSDAGALDLCREARHQLKYTDVVPDGQPNAGKLAVYKCDGSDYPRSHPANTLPDREPCCIR